MRNKITIIFSIIFLSNLLNAQPYNFDDKIPLDPEIRTGILDNGITYYIRHNEEPKNRASFYLYQHVGALLEEDNQNGLAHFLEHMAFNGTQNFPDKGILETLQQKGMKFGADINAYTAYNETVYNLSGAPVSHPGLIDTCLLILHDWCNNLLLSEAEIDAERGVISEEWRTRHDAGYRLREKFSPVLYNNSKYAERDVIGDFDVINNFDYEVLRNFYHDWYRTDLQAISIVGDIDVDEIEKSVIALFSKIPEIDNPKPRPFFEIEEKEATDFIVATDKEVTRSNMTLYIRHKEEKGNTLGDLRFTYVQNIFNQMMAARVKELIQKGSASFLNGSVRIGNLADGYKSFSVSATAKENDEANALTDILTELERVLQHGFTESELDRVKKNMLLSSKKNYTRSDNISNDQYARALKSVFITGVNIPASEFAYNFEQQIIPEITLEEVSALAKKYYTDNNRVLIITGPEKEGIHLTKEESLNIISNIEDKEIPPYDDGVTGKDILSGAELPGGKITKEKQIKDFGAKEWTLSNGAKVVYRFADYEKDLVQLTGYSIGGFNQYEDYEMPIITGVQSFISSYGIGEYDAIAFNKLMTGSTAITTIDLDNNYEIIRGASSPEDFEDVMKLTYMRFERPRFDKDMYENMMVRFRERLKNRDANPKTIMKDTLDYIVFQGHPRYWKVDQHFLDALDYDAINDASLERFQDASDFTFFIVGNIPEDTLKPMVEKYLGSIKDTDRKEKIIDRNIAFPTGKNEYRIPVKMEDNKSTVIIKMQMDVPYNKETVFNQMIISEILKLRYTEEIREKEGGTYGVSVKPVSARFPKGVIGLNVQFDCDPEKADHLKILAYREMEKLQQSVKPEDLNKVLLNIKKEHEENEPHNRFWMNALLSYYKNGDKLAKKSFYNDIEEEITTTDIQKAAKAFFKKTDVVDVIFYPEGIKN